MRTRRDYRAANCGHRGRAREIATSCHAGALMLQALGLGYWMYDGLDASSILGASGDIAMPGIGIHSFTPEGPAAAHRDRPSRRVRGPSPVHFPDMRAAVEAVVARKFSAGEPFHAGTSGPCKENGAVHGTVAPMDTHFIDCVVAMADYIHETFDRFPIVPPILR